MPRLAAKTAKTRPDESLSTHSPRVACLEEKVLGKICPRAQPSLGLFLDLTQWMAWLSGAAPYEASLFHLELSQASRRQSWLYFSRFFQASPPTLGMDILKAYSWRLQVVGSVMVWTNCLVGGPRRKSHRTNFSFALDMPLYICHFCPALGHHCQSSK